MKTAPFTTDDRTVIPCYCWIKKPGTEIRCREDPGHDGNHFNRITRDEWPNRGPEPQ
ncbi:hypothetical protein [Streptomyces sp. NPDC000410]|uniref:hypothetical protein n=1 Tax=Streptomyces sp. NPDC000410 TaxID=3154254 RepID=UPI00332380E4